MRARHAIDDTAGARGGDGASCILPGLVEANESSIPVLANALASPSPSLVDVVSQPLQDARAPVSEWIA